MEVKDFEKNFPVTNSDSGVLGWQNYELTFFSFFSQIFSDMIYYLFHDGKKNHLSSSPLKHSNVYFQDHISSVFPIFFAWKVHK